MKYKKFNTRKDYKLFKAFKRVYNNETSINIDKKKSLLNQLKNRLIFDV